MTIGTNPVFAKDYAVQCFQGKVEKINYYTQGMDFNSGNRQVFNDDKEGIVENFNLSLDRPYNSKNGYCRLKAEIVRIESRSVFRISFKGDFSDHCPFMWVFGDKDTNQRDFYLDELAKRNTFIIGAVHEWDPWNFDKIPDTFRITDHQGDELAICSIREL
jgi:hypothetical protein